MRQLAPNFTNDKCLRGVDQELTELWKNGLMMSSNEESNFRGGASCCVLCFYAYTRVWVQCVLSKFCHQHSMCLLQAVSTQMLSVQHMHMVKFVSHALYAYPNVRVKKRSILWTQLKTHTSLEFFAQHKLGLLFASEQLASSCVDAHHQMENPLKGYFGLHILMKDHYFSLE